MPISSRVIKRSYPEREKKYLKGSKGEDILSDTTICSTVTCLKQLSDLAVFANEIFSELLISTADVNVRLKSLSGRTKKLQEALPKVVVSKAGFKIYGDEYQHHRQMLQNPQSHYFLNRESMPHAMQVQYHSEAVKKRMLFEELAEYSKYFNVGKKAKSIAERYSNPDFFLSQWCAVQVDRMKLIEKEKKQQKVDKKSRKKQRQQPIVDVERKPHKRTSVVWKDR
jgi:hypothetical protein